MSIERDDELKELREYWLSSTFDGDEIDRTANDLAEDVKQEVLYDYEARLDSAESEDFDWRDIELEPEEPHADILAENEIAIDTDGAISRRTRAFQMAVYLGLKHGWDSANIELLTSIFEESGWSSTQRSLDREMGDGMSPDELRMAIDLREVWNANPEFASVFLKAGYYGDRSISVVHWNATLSWPRALKMVRTFDSMLDEAEIEFLLLRFYDEWIGDRLLRNQFRSFVSYLIYSLGLAQGSPYAMPSWELEELEE